LKTPGYWGRLADPVAEEFANRLGQRGVSGDAELVIYSAGRRSKGSDGRVAWMLLYLGANNVRLLDGAWQDWVQQGGPIETIVQQAGKKKFVTNGVGA
jgi:thiosulfate/3-mercaptopyruvate sulfurtransferase